MYENYLKNNNNEQFRALSSKQCQTITNYELNRIENFFLVKTLVQTSL